jgi:phytoene desaturase
MADQKYDVVVIGGGMGGMCAGALAVKEGMRTLVLEKRPFIGGRFSTETIDGFKIMTGAPFIHQSGWVPRICKEVGIEFDRTPCMDVSYWVKGVEYKLPLEHRMNAMFEICNRIAANKTKLMGAMVKQIGAQMVMTNMKKAIMDPEKVPPVTTKEWLLRYTDNEDLHGIIDAICVGMLMAHSYEIPVYNFFHFMATQHGFNDVDLSSYGNLPNMEKLAEVVKRNGEVWLNSGAKKVLAGKNGATGVVVDREGKEVEVGCKVVVSNIGIRETVNLTGEENFTEDYLSDMRVKMRPAPITIIHIASDQPLCMVDGAAGALLVANARRITDAIPLTNACPALAPKGQHLTWACATPPSVLAPIDPDEEERQCLKDMDAVFPDWKKKGGRLLKMEVRNIDHDLPEGRTWLGPNYNMPVETPIKNVFNVGDAVCAPGIGGTSGCAESAKRVLEKVKKQKLVR